MAKENSSVQELLQSQGFYKFDGSILPSAEFDRMRSVVYSLLAEKGLDRSQILSPVVIRHPVLLKWILSPVFLDHVQSVVGPDIVYTSGSVFYKAPQTKEITYWHHDRHSYTKQRPLMENANAVYNFLFSFDNVAEESGAIRYIPGSHLRDYLQESDLKPDSFFMREVPYSVQVPADEVRKAQVLPLKENEMSVHLMGVVHSSAANNTDHGRCLLSVKFCSAAVKINLENFAFDNSPPPYLVRGQDKAGNGLLRLN